MRKTIKTLNFILFFGVLSFNYSFAQSDFRSGYIITHGSDTIHGFILYKSFNTYNNCSFKKSSDNKPIDYAPDDISAFRFNDGKYYVSKETPSTDGIKILFLEYLIKGKANIYYMQDGQEHYYIETDKDKLVELSEPVEIIDGTQIKNSYYKGKLKYLLSDCPEISTEIERVNLNHTELIKLAKDYHEKVCPSEQCMIFERKDKPVKINFGILAGVSFNRFYFHNDVKTNYSPGQLIGCNLEFENLFFSLEHTSLQAGFIFQRFSTFSFFSPKNNIRYNGGSDINHVDSINLNALALKIPIGINQSFLISKFRPYIGIGILNLITLVQDNNQETHWAGSSNISRFIIYNGQQYADYSDGILPGYQLGAYGKIGTRYLLKNDNHLFFELNYEISQDISASVANSYFSIVSGYAF